MFEGVLGGLPILEQSYVRLSWRGPSRVCVRRPSPILTGDRSDRSTQEELHRALFRAARSSAFVCLPRFASTMGRVYMDNTHFTHVLVSQFFFFYSSMFHCSVTSVNLLVPFFSREKLSPKLSCSSVYPFYRKLVAPLLMWGPTCRSSHTALHRVADSFTESSPTNFRV